MASVYACQCCYAHSALVMWIALWPQCVLGAWQSNRHSRAVCAVNLCAEVAPCTTYAPLRFTCAVVVVRTQVFTFWFDS